ncbi:hypothetical protein [Cypionkella sp.]|uniref:hypothetical protein n=1 Tax=Cypionkella sp. TaxID=2811411 RepID=UPI002725D50C|nr:hypothetical protein [Cypionkella sp.]MDO8982865.1 hypothetical protein [Cypionkella sp.]MDP1576393.1 hypothetical protein [Cypionkella sp.]MDP2049613.1 hypothetical protein [Cypionkella sp.]
MLRPIFLLLCLALPIAALPSFAQTQAIQPDISALSQTLKIGALIAVMRTEGLANGKEMEADLFPGQDGAAWDVVVSRVYDTTRLHQIFDAALTKALQNDPATQAAMRDFFGTPLGQYILALEIDARKTLLDDNATEAAAKLWGKALNAKTPRAKQINRFAEINDLVESNVMGALNGNLAFYRGMNAAEAFAQPMPEADMLAEVWSQETDVRRDTTEWLFPFLMLAYQPLSDKELGKYIAFSETPAGQKANRAMFVAFDAMFVQVSKELGQSAGRLMAGQDI